MSEWKECKLVDICNDISYGYTESASILPIGPKFLRITDITSGFVNWDNVPYCIISDENIKKYKLEVGDIVIARTGATTGYTYTIRPSDIKHNSVFASYLIRYRIDTNKADPFFIGHLLTGQDWKGFVDGIVGGSAQPGANAKQFAVYEISLPPLSEQKAIAGVLSSLDDKIDLLHRQNKTLEGMAEALWRKMFVEDVDESWAKGKLGDICVKITKGTTPTTLKKNFVDTGINFIKAESMDDNGCFLPEKFAFIDEETNKLLSRSIIQENDILYTIAGTIGRTAVVTSDILPANTNQAVAIIRLNNPELYIFYIRLLLKSVQMTDDLDSKVVHAVQPNLSLGMITETEIILPNEDILFKFNNKCLSIYLKINENSAQIKTLSKMRDDLLPKLMSGEVRVKI